MSSQPFSHPADHTLPLVLTLALPLTPCQEERPGAEYLGSQLLFYIGKFMKYGRLDSAIGPDEAPWPAWKPELQQEMFFDGDR